MWKTELLGSHLPAETKPPKIRLGESLALLRRDRGLTLKAVSSLCAVSAATLSRIENGTLSPSFDVISNICAGFGIGIRDFLNYGNRSKISGWRAVTRLGMGDRFDTPHYRFEILGEDIGQRPFIVLRAEILIHDIAEFGPLQSHSGHEQIIVESGSVEVFVEQYPSATLKAGDSMAFDSALGHAVISSSKAPAVVLWVCNGRELP